jgi:heterodisulfide reductase subunit C
MEKREESFQEKVSISSEPIELEIHPEEIFQFSDSVKKLSNVDINVCYQCRKCTSGCPVAYAMDYTPTQILHAARLGLKGLVLGSTTIWLCAGCETCVTLCPQDVNIINAMDAMRVIAINEGYKPKETEVADFYRYSLNNIQLFGRQPGENQTIPGLFNYAAISSTCYELSIIFQHVHENIHLKPHFNKRLNVKQPAYFHSPFKSYSFSLNITRE